MLLSLFVCFKPLKKKKNGSIGSQRSSFVWWSDGGWGWERGSGLAPRPLFTQIVPWPSSSLSTSASPQVQGWIWAKVAARGRWATNRRATSAEAERASGLFPVCWEKHHVLTYNWRVIRFLYDQPRQHIKKQRDYFVNKGPSSQGYDFSSGHVWMWELDCEER